jgi:hypothetical protein
MVAAAALLSAMPATVGRDAAAQQPSGEQLAKGRELFRQGVQLEAAGDWAGALGKFEAVAAIKMTPQVRFHTARCQHKLGKLLEALGGYRLAAHEAQGSTDPKIGEVLRESQQAVAEIEQKIPKLLIKRGKGAEAASVTLDGVSLGESSIGKEFPVNPGAHAIELTVPGGKPTKITVTVSEGDSKTIDLVPEPGDKPEPVAPLASASASAEEPKPPPKPPEESSPVLPWIAIGVGGASLVTSGVAFLMRSSAVGDLESKCKPDVCPASMQDTADKGKMYTTLGNVTLAVGLVGVGVGTVLLLTRGGSAPSSESAPASAGSKVRPRMTVVVGGGSHAAEASLVGTF